MFRNRTPTIATVDGHAFPKDIRLHYTPRASDVERVRTLVTETGFFRLDEISIAAELVEERLKSGHESGYHFVMAQKQGNLAGYGCFGPIPCTLTSYDIYWIAVAPKFQGKGLGKCILGEMERLIREMGGIQVYVETSTQPGYASTRRFYERCGYRCEAVLDDFYEPGDGKAIYVNRLVKR
ncbi:GNAT family N-acetyltransferase [uncultured Desulfobacter sp.]|uniref:GNAT family N-acetyltransferase n=1 Tax=uncultured Desulfobacter sp. TaxID=240139 RepID=UPI002AAB51D8|nr:GNAT family N-acetyltransferase [uncultured Desulfobacter sp.]